MQFGTEVSLWIPDNKFQWDSWNTFGGEICRGMDAISTWLSHSGALRTRKTRKRVQS